jgi:hypothetical protein
MDKEAHKIMNVFLMHPDRDFDLQQEPPWNVQALARDLELDTLLDAMAGGDEFVFAVVRKAILSGLREPATIRYRQDVLRDCLTNPGVVRSIYALAGEAIKRERENYWGIFTSYPDTILHRSMDVMQLFLDMLGKLRNTAAEAVPAFDSAGFRRFFGMLGKELSEEYFSDIRVHLKELAFPDGVRISAELGKGSKGSRYALRKPPAKKRRWVERILAKDSPSYVFYVPDRDESGAKALSDLKNRGLNLAANALAQSNDHILGFFNMLRTELAFYIGCLNLRERLEGKGMGVCFPDFEPSCRRRHSFAGLYDACLALRLDRGVVGNRAEADGKDLVLITGANQGGKSTFLRSIGLAQLMLQCGLFVAAEAFCANLCEGLFTHYRREEDDTMTSGKLDEELGRMSEIVDHLSPGSMLLLNESFAATNEREGSEIARQIVVALLEKQVKIFFVTHLYDFAHAYYLKGMEDVVFLRAERRSDGERSFRITEGEPLETSFGEDLYYRIFEEG